MKTKGSRLKAKGSSPQPSAWESLPTADWECAHAKLYLGDCLELLPQIPDGIATLCWTDPPYGHGNMQNDLQASRVRDRVHGARASATQTISNDVGDAFDRTLSSFLDAIPRVLRPDCCCCCCCMAGGGPRVTFARIAHMIDDRMAFTQAVVWDKSARGDGMGWRYRRNYEFVMVAHRKDGKLAWRDGQRSIANVMRHMPVVDRTHPNEKPVDLIATFIEAHTEVRDIVIDPFCGSGSAGVAALRLGRRFIGIELERKYFDIAVRRIDAEARQGKLF